MAITIIRPEDRNLTRADAAKSVTPTKEPRKSLRQIINEDYPYAYLGSSSPNREIPLHSHPEPELMVVLEGSVAVNGESCSVGSVIVAQADVTHKLSIGEEGLVFLIVRPRNTDQ